MTRSRERHAENAATEAESLEDDRSLVSRRRMLQAPRSGFVEVTKRDGETVSLFVSHAPGTPENPLDTEEVNAKARKLMAPILGAARTEGLIERINALEELGDVRELRPFLAG